MIAGFATFSFPSQDNPTVNSYKTTAAWHQEGVKENTTLGRHVPSCDPPPSFSPFLGDNFYYIKPLKESVPKSGATAVICVASARS